MVTTVHTENPRRSGDPKKLLLVDFAFNPMRPANIRNAIVLQNSSVNGELFVHKVYSKSSPNCTVIHCETDACFEAFAKLVKLMIFCDSVNFWAMKSGKKPERKCFNCTTSGYDDVRHFASVVSCSLQLLVSGLH